MGDNIIIPRDLRFCLMQTTEFDVFLQKQVKHQENKMLVLKNNENKIDEIMVMKFVLRTNKCWTEGYSFFC